MLKKLIPGAVASLAFVLAQTLPAAACGGLVAPNGAIRLDRATTLVAWHDGVEHYLTSFTYSGDVSSLGWIVPLPAVPEKVEEGGAWTLQRLNRESHPLPPRALFFGADQAATPAAAEVLQQVQVEALDITVLRGSGQQVLTWAAQNGFVVDADSHDHILGYAGGSPIFMAAKYNTARAQARHQLSGDGSPVLITMRTPRPWVPFEVLALDGQTVNADLFLLTDQAVNTSDLNAVIGESPVGKQVAPGFQVAFQEPMNTQLFRDLSTDRNMGWVRPDGWFTYMTLQAPAAAVTYDLTLDDLGAVKLATFGTPLRAIVSGTQSGGIPTAPLGTPEALALGLLVLGAMLIVGRRLADS
ncbi:MAG TPA: DUF2330 domain-containing protein [Candidatus Eisenbacteria bacterium]|jgi:hypothetical protein|nr:DUF2330 domain-containing protein [Candidatus Eisenbacteria bacterium]